MPLFTMHRNFVLRTTKGHIIGFEKGKPTHVPPICIEDAVAVGAVPVDGIESVDPEKVEVPALTVSERKEAIFKAFRTMAARSDRGDYTASGTPNAKRLPAMIGFEITTTERDAYWLEFCALEREAQDQRELDLRVAASN